MNESFLVVMLVALLVVAAGGGHLLVRDLRRVPTGRAVPPGSQPRTVSVIVPARDEEGSLPALLASVRRLTVPVAEVVVVDDHSQDDTAAVARAGGARVLSPGTPPPGWTGKAWACHQGAGATTGEVLLFLDADTSFTRPDALAGLLELHTEHGGLVSVQPFHRVERPHEQLSAHFNVVSLMASAAFTGRRDAPAMAFGPCLVTSRDDYRRAGGHAVVRSEILDDVSLAAAYRRAGLGVHCAVGGNAVAMRSYPDGLGQLVAGWTKNIASGAAAASPLATLGAVAWICAQHAVAVGALLAVVQVATGWGALAAGPPLLWAVAWVAVAAQFGVLLRRIGSFRWWTWVFFPIPLLAFDLIFARSAALTAVRRSVRWRGREVDLRRGGPEREVS